MSVCIVTPQGRSADFHVKHIRVPGESGDFGVLPGHIPFMTGLRVGAMVLDAEGGKRLWATSGGFIEVLADRVTVLAETAEPADQIDLDRAEASRKRALARLAQAEREEVDTARANAALAKAINRIRIAGEQHGAEH